MALQQINSILSRLTTTLIGGEALCLTLKRRGGADVIVETHLPYQTRTDDYSSLFLADPQIKHGVSVFVPC